MSGFTWVGRLVTQEKWQVAGVPPKSYRVSLWDVCPRHQRQYLRNSMRSLSLWRFFSVM
jgi:hypothetical protein